MTFVAVWPPGNVGNGGTVMPRLGKSAMISESGAPTITLWVKEAGPEIEKPGVEPLTLFQPNQPSTAVNMALLGTFQANPTMPPTPI